MTTPPRLFGAKSDAQPTRGGYLPSLKFPFILAVSHFHHHINFICGGMVDHLSGESVLDEIHFQFKLIGLLFDLVVSEVPSQAFLQESLRTWLLLRHNHHARPKNQGI